ncbi:MAG: hypothetical protein JKP96_10600 [Oceanicaulis sp.]|jgi:hypothetical protein|nr:hypothetical protein [Oceanicaulis sp.]
MSASMSRALAGLILLALLGLVFSQPVSGLLDRYSAVHAQKSRLERLEDQAQALAARIPPDRDLASVSVSGEPQAQLRALDQTVRRAFSGFSSVQISSRVEPLDANASWGIISVQGRGDLIDLDEALERLGNVPEVLQVRGVSITPIGLRRPEDELIINAEFARLVITSEAEG